MRLQDLIAQRKRALDLTWVELVARSEQSGNPVKRSMWHYYADTSEWTNVPRTPAILGMAAALEIEPDDVLTAAAESVGINRRDVRRGARTAAMIALIEEQDERPDEEQEALETALRAILAYHDQRDRSGSDPEESP